VRTARQITAAQSDLEANILAIKAELAELIALVERRS
jgi:hypothetical protein